MRRIAKLLIALLLLAAPASLHAQGYVQWQYSDYSSQAGPALATTTTANDLMVGYAGTQLTGAQASGTFTGATLSDFTTLTSCVIAGCNFTQGTTLNSQVWLGTSPGGTNPTATFNTTATPGLT